jgi:hypothetical protein
MVRQMQAAALARRTCASGGLDGVPSERRDRAGCPCALRIHGAAHSRIGLGIGYDNHLLDLAAFHQQVSNDQNLWIALRPGDVKERTFPRKIVLSQNAAGSCTVTQSPPRNCQMLWIDR